MLCVFMRDTLIGLVVVILSVSTCTSRPTFLSVFFYLKKLTGGRGTGASAIYPLLGCRVDAGWKFIATELDEMSYSYASRNVDANGLSERIHLVKTSAEDRILSVMGSYPTISFVAWLSLFFYFWAYCSE